MDMFLQKKQRTTLIVVQVLMLIIGVILAVIDLPCHETPEDYIGAFVAQPLILAGLFRFAVRAYQYGGLLLAFICPVGTLMLIARVFRSSQLWGNILCAVLLLIAVVLFVLDVRFLVKHRHTFDL